MAGATATQQRSEQITDTTRFVRSMSMVPEAELTEFRRRIDATRWPERETVTMHRRACSSRRFRRSRATGRQITTGGSARPSQRLAAVHHRDRWAGHSFHSRAFEARERVAAHRHPRMARLDHRAVEDHRSTDRSHRIWRERIGRVSPGDSVDARLRAFRQADHHGLGPRSTSREHGSRS